jgi:hypothetical protein
MSCLTFRIPTFPSSNWGSSFRDSFSSCGPRGRVRSVADAGQDMSLRPMIDAQRIHEVRMPGFEPGGDLHGLQGVIEELLAVVQRRLYRRPSCPGWIIIVSAQTATAASRLEDEAFEAITDFL